MDCHRSINRRRNWCGGLFLFLSLQLFTPLSQSAQEIRYLDLGEAILIARQQSPDALIAKHRFRSSYWQFRSYRASYLPLLEMTGTLPELNRSISRISLADVEILSERSYADYLLSMSLSQRIGYTGGSLFLNSGLERLDNFTDSSTLTQYVSTPVNIGYRQPVFKFNDYRWEKKLEPMKYEEAKKRYLEDVEQVSINATNHFFNLFLSQIRERIARINMANYDTLYKIALGRFELGKIAENDLLQLELQYLRANAALEEARIDVENKQFLLRSYLRIKEDIPIRLVPPSNITAFRIDYTRAIAEARKNSSEAMSFERRLLEAEREVNRAKMDGRFDAELFAVYGLTRQAAELDQVYNDPLDEQRLSVGITIPIYDWGVAKGQIRMAQSNQELVRTSVEQEQIDFDQEIFLKVARFNMQSEQVRISAKADTVAQKGYDISKARYLIGKISITDLNIAQTEADASKRDYVNALWTYWVNYYELRKLTLFDFERNMPIQVDYSFLL
ncbi:MAG: TolC family protein [Bacteroidales bacterium]|nr:TolC family protein [Bacteroidales bacterium]